MLRKVGDSGISPAGPQTVVGTGVLKRNAKQKSRKTIAMTRLADSAH
jgi:hypothetical protein